MARPKKNEAPDTSHAIDLTAGAIDRLVCPAGKDQAFLRDAKAPGLRVRVTAAGAKSFVFEGKLNRKTVRRTIGDVRAWKIEDARFEANRMRVTLDGGNDPREIARQKELADNERAAQARKDGALFRDVWRIYLEARRPHWGARHYEDHLTFTHAGGEAKKRGKTALDLTIPGPMHSLMSLRLADLTAPVVEAWAAKEGKQRPTRGRLAWRCLKAFLSWCGEETEYKHLVPPGTAKTRKSRDAFGKPTVKKDVLLKEQLPAWFGAVRKVPNQVVSAYLQTLLLIGSRRGELLELKWEDLNLQWRSMTIRDKVEGDRQIPLTPYVWSLLEPLPRRNEYVFSSAKDGIPHITDPNSTMTDACIEAGVKGLTPHGLRRSFKSLTEWMEIPAGVVAQIMGHKPSATAEKHYTVRPLDLLRVHHERIESWILENAGGSAVKSAS